MQSSMSLALGAGITYLLGQSSMKGRVLAISEARSLRGPACLDQSAGAVMWLGLGAGGAGALG